VELRQLASLPPSAPAEGEIVGGRLAITVADLDKTVAVYRTALGFEVTAPTRFALDPFVRTLTGVRGEVRRAVGDVARQRAGVRARGVQGRRAHAAADAAAGSGLGAAAGDGARHQRGGRGDHQGGRAIVSDGGVRASLPPNFWGITVRMPDNVYMSLLEPCGDCAPGGPPPCAERPAAPRPFTAAVPAISGPVTGPAKMYPDPAISVVPGSPQVEDFPYVTEEYFVTGTGQRRAVHHAHRRAPAEGSVAVQRHRRGRGAARRRPVSHLRVVARVDPDAPAPVRGDRAQPRQHRLLKAFNAERYAPLAIAQGQTNEILAQVGRLVKSGAAPFAGYAIRQMTLMGTSASSGTCAPTSRARRAAVCRRRAHLRRLPADEHQRQRAAADRGRADRPDADADRGDDVGRGGHQVPAPRQRRAGNRYRLYEVAGMPHNNSRENPGFLNDRARCRSPTSRRARSPRWGCTTSWTGSPNGQDAAARAADRGRSEHGGDGSFWRSTSSATPRAASATSTWTCRWPPTA
jgi:hypothetical protein